MTTTFHEMIELGDMVVARGCKALEEVPAALRDGQRRLTRPDKIVSAFLMKMLWTFEALVDDVRDGRGESTHHLKTLCESFIYLIDAASSEDRAKLVLARAYDSQRKYLEAKTNDSPENRERARQMRVNIVELTSGRQLDRESIEDVAQRHVNLPSWYDAVYRLACQPAHIGDLEDFFPTDDGIFPDVPGAARSVASIRYGLEIMLWLASFVNAQNDVGLVVPVEDIANRFHGDEGLSQRGY